MKYCEYIHCRSKSELPDYRVTFNTNITFNTFYILAQSIYARIPQAAEKDSELTF